MPQKKAKLDHPLDHPDFWKRMHKAAKQVEHLPCWQMVTRKNIRPSHSTRLIRVGIHAVAIGADCCYCGQQLTVKQITKELKSLKKEK